MHIGGKFQVNIQKRTSTQTATESLAILNSESKDQLKHRKSHLSSN